MARRPKHIHALASGFMGLLSLSSSTVTAAQTITNIATVNWQQAGQTITGRSNPASFTKQDAPVSIAAYAISPTGSGSLAFTASQCGGSVISVPSNTTVSTQASSVAPTTSIQVGSVFYFKISAPLSNVNPNAPDSIQVLITTSNGDKETLTVYETSANTGVFIGAIQTVNAPPAPVQGDCQLNVTSGNTITLGVMQPGSSVPVAATTISVFKDPFGYVFDSETGASINGATVSIINADTGQPATVVAADGVTNWPSTIISGAPVTDGAGISHPLTPGQYQFPLVAPGNYRITIKPPAPYSAPSKVPAAALNNVIRPDGSRVVIIPGSYGANFAVTGAENVRIDFPVDKPGVAAAIVKSASRATAQEGDTVFYTLNVTNPQTTLKRNLLVVDKPAAQLRINPKTVRVDGAAAPQDVQFTPDGRTMTVTLGTTAGGASHVITYAATVEQNATPGQAPNTATVTDLLGLKSQAQAIVQIIPNLLTNRMTIIGRLTDGGCSADGLRQGIPGVRMIMEDGSYAVTDKDGRYHFDAVVPGDHVVQAYQATLPKGGMLLNCGKSTDNAGSAISRFVSGQGGMLKVADFYATLQPKQPKKTLSKAEQTAADAAAAALEKTKDRKAAGADIDWLVQGDGPNAFLFPDADHNPRSPNVRVAIRHRENQTVELTANGQAIGKIAFDRSSTSADHSFSVSTWSGIPLEGNVTHLVAVIRNADKTIAQTLTRDVYFTNVATQAQLVPEKTHLIADATSKPVLAVRILDRNGRPVHRGMVGDLGISAPYESAEVVDALQQNALSGQGRVAPRWTVDGDDGIAYIELAPTLVSGAVHFDFVFDDGGPKRHQTIDSWVTPGEMPWTLVGLAEGALGSQTIADRMERTGTFESDMGTHARTAFYAKGRVLGKYLLTVAYDSAKQSADQTLTSAINPNSYYTVFADGSNRRFDAASRSKLYLRIEAKGFYAMFGDFQTGLTQTQLARYQRALTGINAETTTGHVTVKGFAAKTTTTHRHLEIQGGGVSGPYSLGTAAIVANSETITLQVRDRLQSEKIISSTQLTRFVDYTVDPLAGTVTFKQPVLSHDFNNDPQFIVVDLDVDPTLGASANALVAGGRVEWTGAKSRVKIGATTATDVGSNVSNPQARTNLGAIDAKIDLTPKTTLRAEAGISKVAGATSQAWQIEAEHHGANLDILTYVHSADQGYGLGDTGNAELGWRKFGVDAKLRATKQLSFLTTLWMESSLTSASVRRALQLKANYKTGKSDFHLGINVIDDSLAAVTTTTTTTTTTAAGSSATSSTNVTGPMNGNSTVVEAGVSRKFLHGKLQVDATVSKAIGSAGSIDAPATSSITARYTLSPQAKIVASYDVSTGQSLNTRTARAGIELAPWQGAKLTAATGEQNIAEYGARSFASFGLSQSYSLTKHLKIDGSVDANKVLSGFSTAAILNAAQPVAYGGQLNGGTTLAENFTAFTLGAGWKQDLWSATIRGEMRNGEFANRKGLTAGLIRQMGDGEVIGAGLTITNANGADGSRSAVFDSSIAFARRPASSPFAMLGKLEYRADAVTAATSVTSTTITTNGVTTPLGAGDIPGVSGTLGNTALGLGNQNARRFIASFSGDWSPRGRDDDGALVQNSQVSLFLAMRYNFDGFNNTIVTGTTLLAGVDAHLGLTDRLALGGSFTGQTHLADKTSSFAFGPSLTFVPATNVIVTIGYNLTGFRDPDFTVIRNTMPGVYAILRIKFDIGSLDFLGLDGRAR